MAGAQGQRKLVLVVVDSLRADMLLKTVEAGDAPTFKRLIERGELVAAHVGARPRHGDGRIPAQHRQHAAEGVQAPELLFQLPVGRRGRQTDLLRPGGRRGHEVGETGFRP